MRTVFYDLDKSEYYTKINNMKFYFSSAFNKRRFENNFNEYVEEEHKKLKFKYRVNIDIYNYLMVAFYKKIEKRGFRVLIYNTNGAIIELTEDYIFRMN